MPPTRIESPAIKSPPEVEEEDVPLILRVEDKPQGTDATDVTWVAPKIESSNERTLKVRTQIEWWTSANVKASVNNLLDQGGSARTSESFQNAVIGVAEATVNDPLFLQSRLLGQLESDKKTDPIEKNRQIAVLASAVAENLLTSGTQIDKTQKRHIDFGKNVDLGGQASRLFHLAADSLQVAEQHASKNENAGSKSPFENTSAELAKSREWVEGRLEDIDNRFPRNADDSSPALNAAIEMFSQQYAKSPEAAENFIEDMRATIGFGHVADVAFNGKLLRDLSLCYLGAGKQRIASGQSSTARQYLHFAHEALAASKKLDPSHGSGDIASMTLVLNKMQLQAGQYKPLQSTVTGWLKPPEADNTIPRSRR